MNRTIFALVNNEPDALMRITGLLRRKGLSMKSISMGETDKPSIAYLVVTLYFDKGNFGQIINCMKKLLDVYSVEEVNNTNSSNTRTFADKVAAIA